MDILVFLLYYTTLIFVLTSYLFLRKKGRLTISDGIVSVVTLVILLGGYFNSYGYRYGLNEFNGRVFLDYYILMLVVPFGLIIGSRINIKSSLENVLDFRASNYKVKILILFVLLYGTLYIYFIKDSVPLFLLLSGRVSNFAELAISRVSITHDYDLNYNIPFILRYYRLVINDLMRFLLAIVFLLFLENKKKHKKMFILTLIMSVFFHAYNFEKSGLVYLSLILFFDYILYKGITFRKNKRIYIKMSVVAILLMIFMYMGFMGAENPTAAFSRMLDRAILGQTSGVYYQESILESRYDGNLWGRGVPTFLLDSVMNRKTIELSKEAYGILYYQYANRGVTGTTGGMPMFYLRSNFGYAIGTVLLFILTIITGIIDNILVRGLRTSKNRVVVVSVYSVMIIYFIQAFMSNFTKVYMLPFLVSPQIMIIMFAIIYLKIGKKNNVKAKKD